MPTQVTAISPIEGGTSVSFQCADQRGTGGGAAAILPTSSITWDSSSVVTMTADADGKTWHCSAAPRGSATSFGITAHYQPTNGDPPATGLLTINVSLPGVTGVTFILLP
jgi:hypothetical protein